MIDPERERLRAALRKVAAVERRVRWSLDDDADAIRRYAVTMDAAEVARDDAQAADAFIQRFEQLFEITLRRLFPATARVVEFAGRDEGLREILDRLERSGYIVDASRWVRRKALRDRLTHEYPDDPGDKAADLNAALADAADMIAELDQFRTRLARVFASGADADV